MRGGGVHHARLTATYGHIRDLHGRAVRVSAKTPREMKTRARETFFKKIFTFPWVRPTVAGALCRISSVLEIIGWSFAKTLALTNNVKEFAFLVILAEEGSENDMGSILD